MDAVAEAGCIACRLRYGIYSPAGIHHVIKGKKRDHMRVLGLCDKHHQTGGPGVALHPFWRRWEQEFGTQEELLRLQEEENGERKSPT